MKTLIKSIEQSFSEKQLVLQLVKTIAFFYKTRRFIPMFKTVRHLSLSKASFNMSTLSQTISLKYTLIVNSHLILDLPSGLFTSGFTFKTCMHLSYRHLRHVPRRFHPFFWSLQQHFVKLQIMRFLLMKTLKVPRYLVPHRPIYLLSTLFSEVLTLCFSHKVKDQDSHPYRTAGKYFYIS